MGALTMRTGGRGANREGGVGRVSRNFVCVYWGWWISIRDVDVLEG